MSSYLRNSARPAASARRRGKRRFLTRVVGLTGTVGLATLGVATGAAAAEPGRPYDDSHQFVTPVNCNGDDLATAVQRANQAGGGTLKLAENCTYTLTKGTTVGGVGGDSALVITSRITLLGDHTTIERQYGATKAFRIFYVSGSPDTGGVGELRLQDVEVRNGLVSQSSVTKVVRGGALLVDQGGTALIERSVFTRNNAEGTTTSVEYDASGGAIENRGTTTLRDSTLRLNTALVAGGAVDNRGTLTLERTLIEGNRALGNGFGGGGIRTADGVLTVRESRFLDNQATGGLSDAGVLASGGAIQVLSGAFNSVTTSSFAANDAPIGGAVHVANTLAGTSLSVTRSEFAANLAAVVGGAAAVGSPTASTAASLRLVDVKLLGNYVAGVYTKNLQFDPNNATGGGGLYVGPGTSAFVERSSLTGNTTEQNGGAIHNRGTLDVRQSLFTYDLARGFGGAIYNSSTGPVYGQAGITESTITLNQAKPFALGTSVPSGGGIYNQSPLEAVTVTNSIVLKNDPDDCVNVTGCNP
ncbi:hypothetical protein [Micromonospora siamensis]|uniref:Polymorphic outer membrane protein repeat-containing protein n=1 Tax=Micromonospora siamensis TaxID=299152 RepID=A0A1C5JBQ1_9ACTN|nr:hypothetical protein [Micromonospora siamensis]SCG67953.1 hypothetical protein GA0074704_4335 [Micromonospora siamensis]